MALTTEQRYRPYSEWTEDEIQKIKENAAKSPWHTNFHIEPPYGLLNDPNGFSFFKGKWQLFYQYFPFGAAHGLKSWVQTESTDLVHFEETGTILTPILPWIATGCTQGPPCNLATNSLSSILEMSVMKTGCAKPIKTVSS